MSKRTEEILGYIHIICGGVSLGLLMLIWTGQISKHDLDSVAPIIITCCLANTTLFVYSFTHRTLD